MLPTIPEEIWAQIIGQFARPRIAEITDIFLSEDGTYVDHQTRRDDVRASRQALLSLCLTYKTFHRLAFPALYVSHSTWPWHKEDFSIIRYLRTLCLKPEYGHAVRALALHARDAEEDTLSIDRMYRYRVFDAITGALFQWRARSFWYGDYNKGVDFYWRLNGAMTTGIEDGWVCLILILCPGITELDHTTCPSSPA